MPGRYSSRPVSTLPVARRAPPRSPRVSRPGGRSEAALVTPPHLPTHPNLHTQGESKPAISRPRPHTWGPHLPKPLSPQLPESKLSGGQCVSNCGPDAGEVLQAGRGRGWGGAALHPPPARALPCEAVIDCQRFNRGGLAPLLPVCSREVYHRSAPPRDQGGSTSLTKRHKPPVWTVRQLHVLTSALMPPPLRPLSPSSWTWTLTLSYTRSPGS